MKWAEGEKGREAGAVAKQWRKACPNDLEPVLYLLLDAQKRNAFPTALGLLDDAERIDAVNSEVRAARLRLLAGSALRHLQQHKAHLAARKIESFEALPQARQGDRPAFALALRYLVAADGGDTLGMAECRSRREGSFNDLSAGLLVSSLAGAAKRGALAALPPVKAFSDVSRRALPGGLARVIALSRDLGVDRFDVPKPFVDEAAKQFQQAKGSLDVGQLGTLGDIAVAADKLEFAYAISAAGLVLDERSAARFLLLRSRALPGHMKQRRVVCAAAAAELARRNGDSELLEQALDLSRPEFEFDPEPITLKPEQAAEVLGKEKAATEFPARWGGGPDYRNLLPEVACDCPECRHARGETAEAERIDEEEMKRQFDTKVPNWMPPGMGDAFFKIMKDAFLNGESEKEMIDRMAGELARGAKAKKGRRT